jgi:hypothetical protein
MKYQNIREEELKNKVAQDYFWLYDCTKIIGNVDFCVSMHKGAKELAEPESLVWAEAKRGSSDLYKSIVQLVLTIGKARIFDQYLPPAFLAAFDGEKIAFVPYNDVQEIFYLNDFNWNVTPSNHDTREFKLVLDKVKGLVEQKALLFQFIKDDIELRRFIKVNLILSKFGLTKTRIDKNNFVAIYAKWFQTVKPTISVNWDVAKRNGIIDADFYLADLLSQENQTLKEKLFVLLKKDHYELDRKIDDMGMFTSRRTDFNDNQVAHNQFWNRYERPPKEDYWDYIIERRDLLVPQDVRERKGSFFTPQIWVELSQQYLADVLGTNWQDEYYIWDCAAGTGNLLSGLTNKYNIYASTLDKQDVEVIQDRIANGANLLPQQVFQFDFLNDEFLPQSKGGKLPDSLYQIIKDAKKRKKLLVYINPPYVESNGKVSTSRSNVQDTHIHKKYRDKLSKVAPELYAQFLARIYFEIPDCMIGQFSKLKIVGGINSKVFRTHFLAKLQKLFVVPSYVFDNVKGQFPIGFFIWDTKQKDKIQEITGDVFNEKAVFQGTKIFYSYDEQKGRINDWLKDYKYDYKNIGILMADAPDFQHSNLVCIRNQKPKGHGICFLTGQKNLIISTIYFTVRHCIEATWINDRDQFLYPNEGWQSDEEFQSDCLTYALFHGQNRISCEEGTNHWIPFTEYEVNAQERFESNFMIKFIQGKLKPEDNGDLFGKQVHRTTPLNFSLEATAVFEAGRALWTYYHRQPKIKVNASFYDIRAYFQGRDDKGRMNNNSEDRHYLELIAELREKLKVLALKLEPKVYAYGFLRL